MSLRWGGLSWAGGSFVWLGHEWSGCEVNASRMRHQAVAIARRDRPDKLAPSVCPHRAHALPTICGQNRSSSVTCRWAVNTVFLLARGLIRCVTRVCQTDAPPPQEIDRITSAMVAVADSVR